MKKQQPVNRKKLLRAQDHMTVPPRLEGRVKEAMMQPVRKQKRVAKKVVAKKEVREYTAKQRKDYQLRSKKH